LLVLAIVSPLVAWNSLGYKAVAEFAWHQLDPTARQAIVDIQASGFYGIIGHM
jgi:hypothetical protein